jgi:hypothetical protein
MTMLIGEILVLLLVASVPAIVLYYFYRLYQRFRNPEKALEREGRPVSKLKRFFYLILGSASVLIGALIFIWVIYNMFVEQQPEFNVPGLESSGFFEKNVAAFRAFFLPGVFICIGLLWVGIGLKGNRD